MKDDELSLICTQLATLLKSGISLVESVKIVAEDTEEHIIRNKMKDIVEHLEHFVPFEEALRSVGGFPEYMIHMVKIGEKTGRLDEVLMALGTYYEREVNIKQAIWSAVFYPLILSGMMLGIIIVLMTKVLPIFNQVLNDLGGEVSMVTEMFISIGNIIQQYALGLTILLVIILLGVYLSIKVDYIHNIYIRCLRNSKLSQKIATARIASAMALMIKSGLDSHEALENSKGLVKQDYIQKKVQQCLMSCQEGDDLASALHKAKLFSGRAISLLRIGVKTGQLDEIMVKIADSYEEEVEQLLSKRVATIEPIAVGVLSIIIGSVVLSAMVPLIGIMSAMR